MLLLAAFAIHNVDGNNDMKYLHEAFILATGESTRQRANSVSSGTAAAE